MLHLIAIRKWHGQVVPLIVDASSSGPHLNRLLISGAQKVDTPSEFSFNTVPTADVNARFEDTWVLGQTCYQSQLEGDKSFVLVLKGKFCKFKWPSEI